MCGTDLTKETLVGEAQSQAVIAKLDPILICAICEQESDWDPKAYRQEPAFYERYKPSYKRLYPSANWLDNSEVYASYGLMQVMFPVAWELGFRGTPEDLYDPKANLVLGCQLFRRKLKSAGGDVHRALQFYNGGSAPKYADQVLARKSHYGPKDPISS